MSRYVVACLIACTSILSLDAHPGVGIVMDSKGAVYYTDLQHIWKIGTDGKVRVAVRNVHSHELYIDKYDNLYGENLWYEGEATDKWGHYVWRLTPEGKFEKIIEDREGFLTDYSFVRDSHGNMYLADRSSRCQHVVKRSDDGRQCYSVNCMTNIRWMTATPEGVVFVIDDGILKRVNPDGTVEQITGDLKERKMTQRTVTDSHLVMGLWTDRKGNVYAAVFGGRKVKKIDSAKNVSTVAETPLGWSPAGGLTSPEGEYWLLEYSVTNKARVERITKEGHRIVYTAEAN